MRITDRYEDVDYVDPRFICVKAPQGTPVKIGDDLSLLAVAQFLEINANKLRDRSFMASSINLGDFTFTVERKGK